MIVSCCCLFVIDFSLYLKVDVIVAVYKSTQNIKWCQSEIAYSAPGIAEYFLSGEWSKFVNSFENKFRSVVKHHIVSKILSKYRFRNKQKA